MSQLVIRFVISARQFDSEGFLYFKDVGCSLDNEIDELLRSPLAELTGGYVFIVHDQIWNSYDRSRFDPEHVRFPGDTLIFSALFVEDLLQQIDERPALSCRMAEMISLHLEFVSGIDVTISGVNDNDQVIYPPEIVSFNDVLKEVLSATDRFVDTFSGRADLEAGEPAETRRRNHEFMARVRATAELLRERISRGIDTTSNKS